MNGKTIAINLVGTSHVIAVPLHNEDEDGTEWLLSNELSLEVTSDFLNALDADPSKVFHFLGSWSLKATMNIEYIQKRPKKEEEKSESCLNTQDMES